MTDQLILIFLASVGVAGRLTQTPSNAIALVEDPFTLKCSSDKPNGITWLYDSEPIATSGCSLLDDRFRTTNNSQATDCFVIALQGNTSDRLSGPYSCFDASNTAQAVIIIIGKQAVSSPNHG